MSGGLDSTVAVYLLQQQGYEVIGVTLQLADHYIQDKSKQSGVIERAKGVCDRFGIEHLVIDQTAQFDKCVVNYFADAYFEGNTPNPCVQCNLHLKWESLLKIADERGIDKVATGHYAKVKKIGKYYHLFKGEDQTKDQSYFLSFFLSCQGLDFFVVTSHLSFLDIERCIMGTVEVTFLIVSFFQFLCIV